MCMSVISQEQLLHLENHFTIALLQTENAIEESLSDSI